jgi:hypothetical protein
MAWINICASHLWGAICLKIVFMVCHLPPFLPKIVLNTALVDRLAVEGIELLNLNASAIDNLVMNPEATKLLSKQPVKDMLQATSTINPSLQTRYKAKASLRFYCYMVLPELAKP